MKQTVWKLTVPGRLAFILVMLWLLIDPLLTDSKAYDSFRTPKEYFALIIILPIAGLWLMHEIIRGFERLQAGTVSVLAIAFLAWNAISLAYGAPSSLVVEPLAQLAVYFLLTLIVARLVTNRRQVTFAAVAIMIPALLSAVYSLLQYYGMDPFYEPIQSYYTGRWLAAGFIGQPTLFGAYLGMVIPLVIGCFFAAQGLIARLLLSSSSLLLLISLLCTHTRAVMLGLVCNGIPFIVLLKRRTAEVLRHRRSFFIAIGSAALLVLIPFVLSNPSLGARLSLLSRFKTDSVGARLFYWRVIFDMICAKPLVGFGLGTFKYHYYDFQCQVLAQGTGFKAYTHQLVFQAHNEYLQVLVETGLIGLALAVGLIVTVLRRGVHSVRAADRLEDRCRLIGIWCGLLMVLFDALFSFPFHITATGLLTAVFTGLLLGSWWQ